MNKNKITAPARVSIGANTEPPLTLGQLAASLEEQATKKQRTATLLRNTATTDTTIRVGVNVSLFGESSSESGLYHLTDHPTLGFKTGKRGRLEGYLTGGRHFSATSVEMVDAEAASGGGKPNEWVDEYGGTHQRIDGVWQLVTQVKTGDWPHTTHSVFELVVDE